MLSAAELDIVDGYVRVCGLYGRDTQAHLEAVGELARQLARECFLDEASVQRCYIAGRVHDLGFVGIDRSILTTPDMLADAEWDLVVRHPEEGARILRTVPGLAMIGTVVEAHHERFDGTGYPHGLYQNEIPIESRIVSIVDAFHAMTVPHPYRTQLSAMASLDELAGNAGTQFDTDLVNQFLRRFQSQGSLIRFIA